MADNCSVGVISIDIGSSTMIGKYKIPGIALFNMPLFAADVQKQNT
jgi:hypothetical protein